LSSSITRGTHGIEVNGIKLFLVGTAWQRDGDVEDEAMPFNRVRRTSQERLNACGPSSLMHVATICRAASNKSAQTRQARADRAGLMRGR
jgi:photosystem II stability/assembly factor-like uncharacterized protein